MSLLRSRLEENKVRFSGKVLDVGARDGRNFSLIKALGAERIYGVDPETKEFTQAMTNSLVSTRDLFHSTLKQLPHS